MTVKYRLRVTALPFFICWKVEGVLLTSFFDQCKPIIIYVSMLTKLHCLTKITKNNKKK